MDKQESNELRARAEALISSGEYAKPEFQGDIQELIQELNIYMAELEAQNDELNQAYVCIEEQSRDNFALFEHAPIAYCVLSEDHRVIKLNKRCRELFIDKGTSQKQFLPIVYKTAQHSTDIYAWLFDDSLPTISIKFSSDPDVWHLLEKKPYHTNQKLIAITDITAQVNSQKELEETSQIAQKANDAKAQFLSNMSHELRTPLTGIMGFLELMRAEDLTDSAVETLNRVQNSANGLLHILNDVLDITKLNDKQLSVHKTNFDLYGLIIAITEKYQSKRTEEATRVTYEIEEDMPQFIHSDRDKIYQIIDKLMSNSAKFTEKGFITIRVSMSDHEPQRIQIMIEDSGIGIPVDDIESLFEEFIQDPTSLHRNYQGTGLGLAISKKLVQLLGGDIDARRSKTGGSQFWFTIPLEIAEAVNAPNSRRTDLNGAMEPLSILLAEDNRSNQLIMRTMLQKMSHRVDVVSNGQEAVDAFHANDYDLIIMDSHMPIMTGYQAAQIIRSSIKDQPKPIPILSWTADARHEHISHVLEIGMNGVLSKPIDLDELNNTLYMFSQPDAIIR